jgi:hypothetical protein
MKSLATASAALALFALQFGQSAPASGHFFPTRPAHAVLYGDSGILTGFGIGNDTAGIAIKRGDGRAVKFYLAFPHTFDGKRATCTQVAEPSIAPGYSECKERLPADIVLGKTHVHVTYWWTTYDGSRVRVTDAISTMP